MIKYLLRRALTWAGMIFVVTNLTWFIANAFLDPASNYIDRRPPIPPDQVQVMLDRYNLSSNEPLLHRWWDWLSGILFHWNWGFSPVGASVNEQVSSRIVVSAQLLLGATILACVIGVAIGVITASHQYKLPDRIFQAITIVCLNTSIIVAALVMVYVAIRINQAAGHLVFYVTGSQTVGLTGFQAVLDRLQHLFIPTICLIIINYPSYHLNQRALLLDNLNADYVRTARAKGLKKSTAIRRHALRTSLIPIAVSVAFSIPGIFTGAAITESIFAWNGMGKYLVETISKNDINGAVAVAAFAAAATAIGAMLSDVVVVALDPRVRVS